MATVPPQLAKFIAKNKPNTLQQAAAARLANTRSKRSKKEKVPMVKEETNG